VIRTFGLVSEVVKADLRFASKAVQPLTPSSEEKLRDLCLIFQHFQSKSIWSEILGSNRSRVLIVGFKSPGFTGASKIQLMGFLHARDLAVRLRRVRGPPASSHSMKPLHACSTKFLSLTSGDSTAAFKQLHRFEFQHFGLIQVEIRFECSRGPILVWVSFSLQLDFATARVISLRCAPSVWETIAVTQVHLPPFSTSSAYKQGFYHCSL
jgi:hypothetical protein